MKIIKSLLLKVARYGERAHSDLSASARLSAPFNLPQRWPLSRRRLPCSQLIALIFSSRWKFQTAFLTLVFVLCGGLLSGAQAAYNANELLLEEIRKSSPNTELAALLLSEAHRANPNAPDENNIPIVIVAATLGHADMVSVLITAGANPAARNPSFNDATIPHLMAAVDVSLRPDDKRAVLQHFGDAIEARATMFNWNLRDANNSVPLELMKLSRERATEEGDALVLREMTDYMILRGAFCQRTLPRAHKFHESCIGASGAALAEMLAAAEEPEDGALRAALQSAQNAGVDLDRVGHPDFARILPMAAASLRASAVSVMVAFGLSPTAQAGERSVPHYAAWESVRAGVDAAAVLRGFIGGLHAAGVAADFDGWNAASDIGRPLEALNNRMRGGGFFELESGPAAREIQALLYERGARCTESTGEPYCRIPTEHMHRTIPQENPTGDVLTLTARDFGGAVFTLPSPRAEEIGELERNGWDLRENAAANPDEIILSRALAQTGGAAVFTVTMMSAQNEAARVFRVRAETGDLAALASLRAAVRRGDAAETGAALAAGAGADSADAAGIPLLIVAATLGYAEVVSVLITADANPDARHPTLADFGVPHLMALSTALPTADEKRAVLQSFGDALAVQGGEFNWNAPSAFGASPLEMLAKLQFAPDSNEMQMADFMIKRGAFCRSELSASWKYQPACIGTFGVSLAAMLSAPSAPEDGALREALQSARDDGIDLERVGNSDMGPLLPMAAANMRGSAVSILITAGLNPDTQWDNRSALNYAMVGAGENASAALGVLRGLIGGLHIAGLANSFSGWNAESEFGRPLDLLHDSASGDSTNTAAKREMQALAYERGARCKSPDARAFCMLPIEGVSGTLAMNEMITLAARDFGGAVFALSLPPAEKLAEMANDGWTLRVDSASKTERLILSRTRSAGLTDNPAVFTVAMTGADKQVAREFRARVNAESAALSSLRAAARTGDAAAAQAALKALGDGYADVTAEDKTTPLLMAAALRGHAQVVSVLIISGANPDARHPTFSGSAVPHMMTRTESTLSRADKHETLRGFGDAVAIRATMYDWNRPDEEDFRPLERMRAALDSAATPEGASVVLRTTDYLLQNGATCGPARPNAWRFHRACIGDVGASLADSILDSASFSESAFAAEIASARNAGIPPGVAGHPDFGHILPLAAMKGNAVAVSILLLAGSAPDETANGRTVPHHAAKWAENDEGEALEIARNFIGGMHAARLTNSAAFWNAETDDGFSPLMLLADAVDGFAEPLSGFSFEVREMHSLMYERGARCGESVYAEIASFCGIPVETVFRRIANGAEAGDALTLTARNFGGANFILPMPSNEKTAELGARGWALRASFSAAGRHQMILSRTRSGAADGPAVFTVTMASYGGELAREFRVHAMQNNPDLARLRVAARAGEFLAVQTIMAGLSHTNRNPVDGDGVTPLLLAAAALGEAEVVSVMIAAGANPLSRHPLMHDFTVPHLVASRLVNFSADERLALLRHFEGAVSVSGGEFDWNLHDALGISPLEHILLVYEESPSERATLPLASDVMLRNGASCGNPTPTLLQLGAWDGAAFVFHPACVGTLGAALAEAAGRSAPPSNDEMRAAVTAMKDAGIDPHLAGDPAEGPVLPLAAKRGHAGAVSILITAGLDPNGRSAEGLLALNYVARLGGENPAAALETARHFIGGLHAAGLNESYENWSADSSDGAANALEDLNRLADPDNADANEVHALIYERGGRCGENAGGKFCDIPAENGAALAADDRAVGGVFTVVARNFGGAVFTLPLPHAEKTDELTRKGWNLWSDTAAPTDALILTRSRAAATVEDSVVFTVTMMSAQNRPSREFRIFAETTHPSLRAAIRAGDVERVREIVESGSSAHLNIADNGGIFPLVEAATLGHAEIVSVLIAAGANPEARNPRFFDTSVPHMMSARDFPLTRAVKWAVLRHFGDAVAARAVAFNWNLPDRNSNRPLDLLPLSHTGGSAGEIVMQMADYMIEKGALCRDSLPDAQKYHRACMGSVGAALADVVIGHDEPDDDAVRAALRAAREAGVDLSRIGSVSRGKILPAAAFLRRAHAVSILLTAGLDPNDRSGGRAVLHHVGRKVDLYAEGMLDVLRHFIGGLHAAGLANSFDGWNDRAANLRGPRDALSSYGPQEPTSAALEIAALMHERGARCSPPATSAYCRIPVESRRARIGGDAADWALTLTARDFGGAVFTMPPPDAGKMAELTARGWRLRANAAATPDEMILSRARPGTESEEAVFTVTMTAPGNQAAREFQVRAEIVAPRLASLWSAVRAGDAAQVELLLSLPGPSYANATDRDESTPLLIVAATLGHAGVVSALVAAGANPDARDPSSINRGVPHLMSANNSSLSWAQKSEVLRHFVGAMSARATVLNWNLTDGGNRRPLDLLQDRFDNADAGGQNVILQMSDLMLQNGASCQSGAWPYSPACLGSRGFALVELLSRPEGADDSEVVAAVRAITDAGISLTLLGSAEEPFLSGAAEEGLAAVSILIVAGMDPAAEDPDGYNILHFITDNSEGVAAATMLEVTRHFIGGLHAAGLADSFDGWNSGESPALSFMRHGYDAEDAAGLEIAALLYERGARCGEDESGPHCRLPFERRAVNIGGGEIGPALTLTARDFGGAAFTLSSPDADKLAELADVGLTLLANTAANPDEMILSLSRQSPAGGSVVFTVTMTDSDDRAAREFRVSAEIAHPLLASLWNAAQTGDAEGTRSILTALGPEYVNTVDRDGITPLLIAAATLGHAEVVSVLVVAGADPDPVWHEGRSEGVLHLMAVESPRLRWTQKSNVLQSFSGALDARATMVNWNRTNISGKSPLELLGDSLSGASAGDRAIILRMSDLMLQNGALCGAGEWPYSDACVGSLGRALVDILDRNAPDGAAAFAAWRAIEEAGMDPNWVGGEEEPILEGAGLNGRAAAVSVLITIGANPNGPRLDGGLLDAIADNASEQTAPGYLKVTRYFLGGLHAAGLADSFDGWNRGAPSPLALLDDYDGPAAFEMAALLYERGARCGLGWEAGICGVPTEIRAARVGGAETDWAMTLAARDFAGAVFSMPLPDPGKLAELQNIGLTLRANAQANPEELVLSLAVAGEGGGSAVFTVTMMTAENQVAREFRVRAEIIQPLLASLWNAARAGDAERTRDVLTALGPEHADAVDRDGITPLLIVAATLGHAEVVGALVAAGANPDARHPAAFNRSIPHLMAADGPPHSLSQKLAVLRSFSAALTARATVLNWNRFDSFHKPPLDLLNEAYEGADDDARAVMLQIAEEMLKNRATCKNDEWPYPVVCVGSLGRVLVDSLDRESPDIAAVSIALRAVTDAGIDPNLLGSKLWPLMPGMAVAGRAAAVSVAIVAGADPEATDILYEIGYNAYNEWAPVMLTVMRHFLGGLHVAGLNDSFDGWNFYRPLDDVDASSPEALEVAALMYERGSRCRAGQFERACRIPVEDRASVIDAGDVGWALTLTARDFAGAVFTLPPPDAGKLAELENIGLTLRTDTAANPDEAVVSLARRSAGGAAVFTVTMMSADNQPAREFRMRVDIMGSLLPSLWDAVRAGDAAQTRELLAELGAVHANTPDNDGIVPLVMAATLGHAEVVSVLVDAGANPAARNSSFFNAAVPHMMAAFDFPLTRDAKWAVLNHFGDAVAARAAVFNWNLTDGNGARPLDLLPRADAEAASDGERAVILQMSDYMIGQGALCRSELDNSLKYHKTCMGTRGAALAATITGPATPDNDGLRAALQAAEESGVDLNRLGSPVMGGILPAAAFLRRAHAVSILLAAGLDPSARSGERSVLHHVGRKVDLYAAEMLEVLRHFIGGLHVAGRADSFNGWNDWADIGRPLDALSHYVLWTHERTATKKIQELMYERGARCAPPASREYCDIPVESRFARVGADDLDWSLTLTARDFGGAVFTLPAPDAGKTAELEGLGLTLRMNTAANPDEMIASLARQIAQGGDAVFTITMMSADNQPAREFRVRTEIAPLSLVSLWNAVRSGDAAGVESALAESGPAHANAADSDGVPLLLAAALLGHAEVVSVLVAAGANPDSSHSSRHHRRLPHLMSSDDSTLARTQRLEVLQSFIGAIEARTIMANWNQPDSIGQRPLELLRDFSEGADAEDKAVVLQMSDAMLRKGAMCRFGTWPYSPACLGSQGLALVEMLNRAEAPDVAEVRAAMLAMTDAGLDPNATGTAYEPVLLGLAATGRAAAVSVFIAAGADPAASSSGYGVPHLLSDEPYLSGAAALNVLRHFIGGMFAAGVADSFNWNSGSDRPMDYLGYAGFPGWVDQEMAALMYERGARCSGGGALCGTPVENVLTRIGGDEIDQMLTLTARDFAGAVFTLPLPDAGKLAEMEGAGFTLLANTAANPDEVILSRLRESPGGETAVFTVTMMSSDNRNVREFRVRAETTSPLLPSLWAAVHSGDAETARTLLTLLGDGRANERDRNGDTPLLAVAVTLGHAEVVSVLIAAGADPNTRHPAFMDSTIPHLLAGDYLTLSREVKLAALRSFGDAVESRATVFNWNQPDASGAPPLELLPAALDGSEDAGEREVILRMTDYMLELGARCRAEAENALRFHAACVGTMGGALAALLSRTQAPDEAETRSAVRAMTDAGISPGVAGLPERGHILPIVADMGRAAAVSILLAAGADPNEKSDGRNVPHHAAWNSGEDAPMMLEVMRGFIGGMSAADAGAPPAALRDSLVGRTAGRFDGWNEPDGGGNLPLDLLSSRADSTDLAALEIRALMYERGARCENPEGGVLCETPEEWRTSDAAVDENYLGDVMTIVARNFGDAIFSLELTDADDAALLEDSGWQVESRTDSGGARLVLSRTRARRSGDLSAQFSAVARADGVDARAYKISACFVGDSDMGGLCVPEAGNFEGIPQESLCGAYGGERQAAGDGAICSGIDVNDTFCIEDSREAFPCRGLFKHVRACNMEYNRRALNPMLCGAKCATGEKAMGARCCDAELLKSGMCVESGE